MDSAIEEANDFRLRWVVGKEHEVIEKGNVYGEKFPEEEFDGMMDDLMRAEFIRNRILSMVKDNALSVKELAKQLDLDPAVVLKHVSNLQTKGLIALDKVEGNSPLYIKAQ